MKIKSISIVFVGGIAYADNKVLQIDEKNNNNSLRLDIANHDANDIDTKQSSRTLESYQYPGTNCWINTNNSPPIAAWHPIYSAGWSKGYCHYTIDCNSPSYDTELSCCNGAYQGQTSGYCYSQLDNPPTISPTDVGKFLLASCVKCAYDVSICGG